jgi:methionine-rich copper-binding protein CopC
MTTGGTRFIKILRQLFVIVVVLWIGSGLAGAHSVVIESSPKDKEVLTHAPRDAVLRFSARIEKSLARIILTSSDGRTIPLPGLIREDTREAPDLLVIPLPNLGPGEYLLRYRVLSTDGHATSGVLRFSVVSRP